MISRIQRRGFSKQTSRGKVAILQAMKLRQRNHGSDQAAPISEAAWFPGLFLVSCRPEGWRHFRAVALAALLMVVFARFADAQDTIPPTITAPAGGFTPQRITTGAGSTVAMPDYTGQAVTSDNIGVTSVTQSPAAGGAQSAGVTHVTLTAHDLAGNTASTSFDVAVINDGTQFRHITGEINSPASATINSHGDLIENGVTYPAIFKPSDPPPAWVQLPSISSSEHFLGSRAMSLEVDAQATYLSGDVDKVQQRISSGNDAFALTFGAPRYTGFALKLPGANFQIPEAGRKLMLAQWWQGAPYGPPVQMEITAATTRSVTYRFWVLNNETLGNPSAVPIDVGGGTIDFDAWNTFVVMLAPDYTGSGQVKVWQNGTQIISWTGKVGYDPSTKPYAGASASTLYPNANFDVFYGPYRERQNRKHQIFYDEIKFADTYSGAALDPIPLATTITSQPTNVAAALGQPASFSVTATGSTLSYQWFKNGAATSGATNATFLIASTQASDLASYYVIVSNSFGTATSSDAVLGTPPTITAQPQNQTGALGRSAQFTAAASGGGTLSYQWYFNGVALSNSATVAGSTTPTLTFPNVSKANQGSYVLVVSNSGGSTSSTAATLTVDTGLIANDPFTDGSATNASGGDLLGLLYDRVNGTIAAVDDSAGIGSGNALQITPTTTAAKAFAEFDTVTLTNAGDFVQLQFDFRYTQQPDNVSAGFRWGLYQTFSTHTSISGNGARNDDVGYGCDSNPGGTSGGTHTFAEGAGDDILTSGAGPLVNFSGGATSSNLGTNKHTVILRVTRQANGDLLVTGTIDGTSHSGTSPSNSVSTYSFNELALGNGSTTSKAYAIDNVTITHNADTTTPTIGGTFSPLTLTTGASGTAALPDYTTQAVTSDNVGVISVTQSPVAGSAQSAGTTRVTLTASDAAGNTASTSFDVLVNDGTLPTISGTFSPLTLTTGAGGTISLPDYTGQAVTSDDVGVTSVTQSPSAEAHGSWARRT